MQEIKGKYNTIKIVDPETTYFVAEYEDKKISGGGLEDTQWKDLPDGIIRLSYHLSTGTVIEIPQIFKAYMHLVEVSQAVYEDQKIYHFVYIKCKKVNDDIEVSYRISLKEDKSNNLNIGDVFITEEKVIKSPYWKKSSIG